MYTIQEMMYQWSNMVISSFIKYPAYVTTHTSLCQLFEVFWKSFWQLCLFFLIRHNMDAWTIYVLNCKLCKTLTLIVQQLELLIQVTFVNMTSKLQGCTLWQVRLIRQIRSICLLEKEFRKTLIEPQAMLKIIPEMFILGH